MGQNPSDMAGLTWKIIDQKNLANAFLQEAESSDLYLKQCYTDKSNSLARRNLTYSANRITDKDYYQKVLEESLSKIPKRLKLDLREVVIIFLMPSADGGMPHTRPGNIICVPHPKQLLSISTVIHELWHVHQRMYKKKWSEVFSDLGWSEWKGTLPTSLNQYRRFNPDTIDSPLWIYRGRWVPVPVFKDISRPQISEVNMWFYDIEHEARITSVPLELSSEFPNLPQSAYEHPRELTAYLLADHATYSHAPGFLRLIQAVGHLSISN